MTEEHTPYDSMYGKDEEPETVEDLTPPTPWTVPEVEAVEEAPVEVVEEDAGPEVVEEIPQPEGVEAAPSLEGRIVRVDIDGVAKLRLRSAPSIDGEIVDQLMSGTSLKVISEEGPEWLFVEVEAGEDSQLGYVKKIFVTEA